MSTATLTTRHPLARRGAAYISLVKELDRRGETALHKTEREQIIDCADALLFDEPTAQDKLAATQEMLEGLSESERWTEQAAADVTALLYTVGEVVEIAA